MKVSFNLKEQAGAYGGGNQFKNSLADYLRARGIGVVNDLRAADLDFIVLISPLPIQESCAYSYLEAARYAARHPGVLIIQRVNYCDKTRGSKNLDRYFRHANLAADYTVFISHWIRSEHLRRGMPSGRPYSVIYNGADTQIFNRVGQSLWRAGEEPLSIVTHHWSTNSLKGHDIYQRLDQLLADPAYAQKFSFTYIGKLPAGAVLRHTRVLPPLYGPSLAAELKRHHLYLTAAQNEPAGMHHIEAGNCGLPILCRLSGALPEYCRDFGLGFTENDFEERLREIHEHYFEYRARMSAYPFTADFSNEQYYQLFLRLQSDAAFKQSRVTCRPPWPWWRTIGWRLWYEGVKIQQKLTHL